MLHVLTALSIPSNRQILDALVFAVHDCGYVARSAQELRDTGEVRIDKILRLIEASKFGIHDISRTDLDPRTRFPRFNMPLELGIFLGARAYGMSVPAAAAVDLRESRA